ncbi:MAG: hypothetical protein ABI905_09955 [Betaproteobacteria bacterium]
MPKTLDEWKVLPHGKLSQIDDNILTVVGELHMPLVDIPRRMTVVRLRDSRLVIFSAISLEEYEMAALQLYGEPSFLIVPNDHHRLDAKVWKQRYPAIQVVAPAGSRKAVEEEVPVDNTAPAFNDPDVVFITVPGTREHEAAMKIRTQNGTTLVLNDLIGNVKHASGFGGWLLRMMGFAGDEPHIPQPAKLMMIKDKEALRTQLMQWATIEDLRRIVVSHGEIITARPQDVLRELAETLG